MICIKKIICLFFCIFLISCTEKSIKNPFDENSSLKGIFDNCPVTVTKEQDTVTVKPESPEGYSITFSKAGAQISFNGIEFLSSSPDLSRFYPLFEMAHGINTTVSESSLTHSKGYVFGNFK